MKKRNTLISGLLSLILPGLGQFYNAQRSQGLTLLCMDIGILGGIALAVAGPEAFRSTFTVFLMGFIYLFVWIPAVIDAYQYDPIRPSEILSGKRMWYVVMMLLCVGPMAIPLLWQSPVFSKRAKWIWTIFVMFVFISSLVLIIFVVPKLEAMLAEYGIAL